MNSLTDYTQTQRIVLLIDLTPLISNHIDPDIGIDTISRSVKLYNCVKLVLTFSPLSNSLFSVIPFFSSLSPLLSAKLLNSRNHLSFSTPLQTLATLKTLLTLNPVLRSVNPQNSNVDRAANIAANMRQLLYDYAWDAEQEGCSFGIRSSLVLLFSPIVDRFGSIFRDLSEKFGVNDIHFSWVDVGFGSEDEDSGVFEKGVRGLGWGFLRCEAMVFGSSLVPFGLVYPKIGVSWGSEEGRGKKGRGEVGLEIMDVNGKPLECKCCDLELVGLESRRRIEVLDFESDGSVKIVVKAVQRNDELSRLEGKLGDVVLVREGGKYRKESFGGFADRVVEFLEKEFGVCEERRAIPIWQMFLSFLYREGYWALVVLSNGSDNTLLGVLKPFTVSLGLLSVIDPKYTVPSNPISAPSSSKKDGRHGDRKRKKIKRDVNFFQDLNWSAFSNAAYALTEIGLDEIFFATVGNSSKKLKFFKCWMNQIGKSSYCSVNITDESKPTKIVGNDVENRDIGLQQPMYRLTELPQEGNQPFSSSASAGENSLAEASSVQAEAAPDDHLETMESFFSTVFSKMQQAINSDGIDLAAFAERLVNSSIYWLHQRHESEANTESQHMELKSDDTLGSGANDLIKHLLKEPKDLASKHVNNDLSLQASDVGSGGNGSGNIVREYELQILLRLEILRTEASPNTSVFIKQKIVKQICLLLENIQFHMEADFFADWSLGDYVEKTIKIRYADTLEDVVLKIYSEMDLLLFEDKTGDMPLNSDESNQSWKVKGEQDDVRSSGSVSVGDCSFHMPEAEKGTPTDKDEQTQRLTEARERREKAKRLRSFTSWMPDLQKVPQKAIKAKLNPFQKISRRKGQQRAYDVVCETPRSGRNIHPFSQGSSSDDDGNCKSQYVSKALFQDQEW